MRTRSWASCPLAAGLAALLVFPAPAIAEIRLEISPAGDGSSLTGSLDEDGTGVKFESFDTGSGAEARIRLPSGEVLTEVIVDEASGTLEYRAGGVRIDEHTLPEDLSRAFRVFDRPEAALVARELWTRLVERGADPESRSMAGLAAVLVGYETVPARYFPSGRGKESCLGCCGPSCWGCTGCYTRACLLHDLCVMTGNPTRPECNALLTLAAISAWCCRGVHLGRLC